jgi:hypothetical protein
LISPKEFWKLSFEELGMLIEAINYKEYNDLLYLRELMYKIERPNLRNRNMNIDSYMKLTNPLEVKKPKEVKKEEITPETMDELREMEKIYKRNYVECKIQG